MKTLQQPQNAISFGGSTFTANTAILAFKEGWTDEQSGDIVRRGRVEIDYDIWRLPSCFRPRHGAEIGGQRPQGGGEVHDQLGFSLQKRHATIH